MSETKAIYGSPRAGSSAAALCDGDCNHCPVILHPNSRMLTAVLNALKVRFGDGVHEIVQGLCPNMTVCPACRVDDFVHIDGCYLAPPAEDHAPDGLVTTIRWHRPAEQMPPYGVTVVVWIQALGITSRAYRGIPGDMWRVAGTTSVNVIHDTLITAWTDAPNGPLPPPDGGEG